MRSSGLSLQTAHKLLKQINPTKYHDSDEKREYRISRWPLKPTKAILILGLTFGNKLNYNQHTTDLMNKTKTRLNIIRILSGPQWGAGSLTLQVTTKALIISKLTCGITSYAITAANQNITKLMTHILNPAARMITGVTFPLRREIIITLAGIQNSHNLYIKLQAIMMDRAIRAKKCKAGLLTPNTIETVLKNERNRDTGKKETDTKDRRTKSNQCAPLPAERPAYRSTQYTKHQRKKSTKTPYWQKKDSNTTNLDHGISWL